MRNRQRQPRGKPSIKQPLSPQRIWLRKLNVPIWALCQFIDAFLTRLYRLDDPTAFVKALIEIGDGMDAGAPPRKPGMFRSWDLFLRSYGYMQIVFWFVTLQFLIRGNLGDDEIKRVTRFSELALLYYEAAAAKLFQRWAVRSFRGARKIRGTRAQLHITIATMYERFGLDDMSRDLNIAFEHYDAAAGIIAEDASPLSNLAAAHVWASRADAQLAYPVENRAHYARQAIDALVKAREIVAPYLISSGVRPALFDDPKAWKESSFGTKLKTAAPYAARLAAGRWKTSGTGIPDPVTAEESIPSLIANVDRHLGRAYEQVGEYDKAVEHLTLAISEFTRDADLIRAGIEVEKGYALLASTSGDRRKNIHFAIQDFKTALTTFRQHKKFAWMLEKTFVLALLGDAKAWFALHELKVITPDGYKKGLPILVTQLRTVARKARAHALVPELQESLFLLGRVYALQRDGKKSYQALVLAARVAGRLQRRARTPRVGRFLTGTRAEIDDLLVRVSMDVASSSMKTAPVEGRRAWGVPLKSIFYFAERARTVFLQTQLANLKLLPKGAASEELEGVFERRRSWHAAELRLMEHESTAAEDDAILNSLQTQRDLHESRYRSELQKARRTYNDPDYDPDKPIFSMQFNDLFSTVSGYLQETNAAIVEYYLTSRYPIVFVLLPTEINCQAVDISLEQLDAIRKHWEKGWEQLPRPRSPLHWESGYLRQVADRLQPAVHLPAKLIGEWEQNTGRRIEKVIVVPHRFLHLVPLHVVPLPNGKAWGEAVSIQYVPSASVLAQLLRTKNKEASRPGHSGHAAENGHHAVGVAYASPGRQQPLPFLRNEAEAVIRACGGTLLEGQDATPRRVKEAIRDATYIHFACHGTFKSRSPMESALELAAEETTNGREAKSSGSLTLAEIFEGVRLSETPVVVLSACETGLTKIEEKHDEYIGLPAGFFYAGATTVISTLWPIADVATWLLMRSFARQMATGADTATALQGAQRELRGLSRERVLKEIAITAESESDTSRSEQMIRQGQELPAVEFPFASPFWWAGFTVNGL